MLSFTSLSCVILFVGFVRGGEICCDDIGCFSDDPPYDHYRLPKCPADLPSSYELFTQGNRDNGEDFARNAIPSNFDASKRTVLLLHGYMNDRNTDFLFHMKDAMLTLEPMNVIIVGWGGILDYPVAASTTRAIGAEAAFVIDNLVKSGANPSNFWCVGFSLGAHACGHVGMRVSQKMGRVTGLDPAGPWFENYDPTTGINPTVADFVDIIHTMAHSPIVNWGILRPVGHMDFYPNGGDNLQPGCLTYYADVPLEDMGKLTTAEDFMFLDIACSHGRAVDYFIESILSNCFVARETCTDPEGIPNNCNACNGGSGCAHMGYHSQSSGGAPGIYYLDTNSREPYCRG